MLNSLFDRLDKNAVSALLLRITSLIVIFPHGASLMLGWFGGKGFTAAAEGLSTGAGLPYIVAVLVILLQFFGSIALGLGIFTRYFGVAIFILFAGMIPYHTDYGFFMNWFGEKGGEGYEFHLLVLGICAALIVSGAGKWSLDNIFYKTKNTNYSDVKG